MAWTACNWVKTHQHGYYTQHDSSPQLHMRAAMVLNDTVQMKLAGTILKLYHACDLFGLRPCYCFETCL